MNIGSTPPPASPIKSSSPPPLAPSVTIEGSQPPKADHGDPFQFNHRGLRASAFLSGSIWQDMFEKMSLAKYSGHTPVMVCDIDDTVVDAGNRVVRLGYDWFYNHYDGSIPGHFMRYPSPDPFDPTTRPVIHFGIQPHDWNIVSFLKRVMGEYVHEVPDMMESADRYFRDNFFDLNNWKTDEIIYPTLALIRAFHENGGKILFTSLRGREDDIVWGGASYTAHMLKEFGAWKDGDELVFKPGKSEVINAGEDSANQVSKAEMVVRHLQHRTAIRGPLVVAALDNDPKKLNELYREPRINNDALQVLVLTNAPAGSPNPLNPDIRYMHPGLPSLMSSFLAFLYRFAD